MRRSTVGIAGVAWGLLTVVSMVGLTGCNDRRNDPGFVVDRVVPRPDSQVDWESCGDGADCARIDVPQDSSAPRGPKIELALARHSATRERVGVVLVNPGGPGAPGLSLAQSAARIFPSAVVDHFDIVAWDPRGTGESDAVDCGSNLDAFWHVDTSPDNAGEVRAAVRQSKALVAACAANTGEELAHISSTAVVDDMDAIRAALGENTVSYIGFSYGTYLGLAYRARYPERVRAMVFDGVVDPYVSMNELAATQAEGFDGSLDAFFAWCAGNDECGFGGRDPAEAYDSLYALVDAETVPGVTNGETRELGPGEFDIGVAAALYGGRAAYPALGAALAATASSDSSDLLALADSYTGRGDDGTYDSLLPANYATACRDAPVVATLEDLRAQAAFAAERATRFGAATVWLGLPCVYWPYEPEPRIDPKTFAVRDGPPVVLVSTTGDPATPYRWGQNVAVKLGETAQLLTHNGTTHTAIGESECVDRAVARFLVAPTRSLVPPVCD